MEQQVFIFAVFHHYASTNTCSIRIQKLPIILQLNYFSKYAIKKIPKLWILLLWECRTCNKRSQFLTKLTVRSRLYNSGSKTGFDMSGSGVRRRLGKVYTLHATCIAITVLC